jgi:hypothetical protein
MGIFYRIPVYLTLLAILFFLLPIPSEKTMLKYREQSEYGE